MFAGPNTKALEYGDKDLRVAMFVLQSGSEMAFEFANDIGKRMGAECSVFSIETGDPPTLREWDPSFDAAENESAAADFADWANLILEETKRKVTGLIVINADRNHIESDKFRSQLSDLVDSAECPVIIVTNQ